MQAGRDRRATAAQLAGLPALQAVLADVQAVRADVLAAVATTQAAPRAPEPGDDAAAGYRLFSRFFDTGRQVVHELLDATAGAAAWVRRGLAPELPRRLGENRYYCAPTRTVTTIAPLADRLYLRPIILHERHAITGVAVRSTAALGEGANSGMRASIYRSEAARPRGAPLAADSLGAALGGGGVYLSPIAAVLRPGEYWIAVEFTARFDPLGPVETLPTVLTADQNNWDVGAQIGVSALANTAIQGFRVVKSWGAAAPDFAAAHDWDAVAISAGMPIPFLRLA